MSFILIIWLAACSAVPADDPDPPALVAKLASADSAERDSATRSLRALGRSALPALQSAAKDGADAGLRERASGLWDAISRDLMTRPSLVQLSVRGRDRETVIKDIGAQAGLTVESDQSFRGGIAVDDEPAPIPFWTAVDRLGLKGIFHSNPGEGKFPKLDFRASSGWKFIFVDGPFRVALTGLHLHRDRRTIAGPWVRIDGFGQRIGVPIGEAEAETASFFGDLNVMVEPRMYLTQEEPTRLIEAVDDLGHSLLPDPVVVSQPTGNYPDLGFHPGSGVTETRTGFRLKIPNGLGKTTRLRGVIPLMLHLRRPDPALVIPLTGAAGQTFRADEVEIKIESVDISPLATIVKMIVKLDVAKAELPANAAGEVITSRLQVIGQHQLQLTDPAGTVLAWSTGGGSGGGTTPEIYRWTIASHGKVQATHLRYYGMLRARAEAAFDFRDVPIP